MPERKRKRIPDKIRQRIYDMYGGRCAYNYLTVDIIFMD